LERAQLVLIRAVIPMLTSLQNPLVKQLRKLHRTKERRSQQMFLLEGTHLIQEALATHYPLLTVCYTENWRSRHPQLWAALAAAERLELVSPEIIAAIATTDHPDGIVATAPHQSQSPPQQSQPRQLQLGLALETLQDPGNLGTVIRTAAAAGAEGLWLSDDSVDLESPKVLRASAGQWFRLPMTVTTDLAQSIRTLQQQGVQVVTTVPTAETIYWDVDLTRPTLIVLGNEGAGLSEAIAALADVAVTIPLAPAVESLNVAIAAALMLYEAKRQRK
jgi:RNA methyltransferase, TrmH family